MRFRTLMHFRYKECVFYVSDTTTRHEKYLFFFLNDPAPPETSPLPLPAALPTWRPASQTARQQPPAVAPTPVAAPPAATSVVPAAAAAPDPAAKRKKRPQAPTPVQDEWGFFDRSEEHTSELQSQSNLVCRLLLEK